MAPIFESERLVYRAIEPADDFDTIHSIRTNADTFRLAFWEDPVPQSRDATKAYIDSVISKSLLTAMICLRNPDQEGNHQKTTIGFIGLSKPPESNTMHRNVKLTIDILPDFQSKGYGTEAIEWALRWAFVVYGFHRVQIRSHEFNDGAIRLWKKLGFVEEGRWREHVWYEGRFWDYLQFGILDREWKERQETN